MWDKTLHACFSSLIVFCSAQSTESWTNSKGPIGGDQEDGAGQQHAAKHGERRHCGSLKLVFTCNCDHKTKISNIQNYKIAHFKQMTFGPFFLADILEKADDDFPYLPEAGNQEVN